MSKTFFSDVGVNKKSIANKKKSKLIIIISRNLQVGLSKPQLPLGNLKGAVGRTPSGKSLISKHDKVLLRNPSKLSSSDVNW